LGEEADVVSGFLNQLDVSSYELMNKPFADHYKSQIGFQCLITIVSQTIIPNLHVMETINHLSS
jgi:hypothetical protein